MWLVAISIDRGGIDRGNGGRVWESEQWEGKECERALRPSIAVKGGVEKIGRVRRWEEKSWAENWRWSEAGVVVRGVGGMRVSID